MADQSDTPGVIPVEKAWIEAAKCPDPDCGGQGWKPVQVGESEWEQEQCQWCWERQDALRSTQSEKPEMPDEVRDQLDAAAAQFMNAMGDQQSDKNGTPAKDLFEVLAWLDEEAEAMKGIAIMTGDKRATRAARNIPLAAQLMRSLMLTPSATRDSEIARLREIEHLAWHLLDDSEHRMNNGEIVVLKSNFDALSALLSEEHPSDAADRTGGNNG